MERQDRIFNVPGIVVTLLGVLIVVHLVRNVLPVDDDVWFVFAAAFIPARYGELGALLPGAPWAAFTSPLTHMLLHGDIMHLVLNGAWLLAVGTPIARRTGAVRFVLFSIACGLAGALAFYVVNPGVPVPVIGASGAISGLMGAMFRLVFAARDPFERDLLRLQPEVAPKLSVGATFTDQRALLTIAAFVGINLLFAAGLDQVVAGGGIAWEAHIGGFMFGLIAFDVFDRRGRRLPRVVELGDDPSHM